MYTFCMNTCNFRFFIESSSFFISESLVLNDVNEIPGFDETLTSKMYLGNNLSYLENVSFSLPVTLCEKDCKVFGEDPVD